MKKMNIFYMLIISSILTFSSFAQYKTQNRELSSVAGSLIRPVPGINGMLSWFNPENFRMSHNFSMQYISGGGSGMSLASYTNSMFYKIADPLDVRLDLSLMGSPFGANAYQTDYSKIFISRAELNYKPWENFHIHLQYRQLPINMYGYYMPYHWYFSPIHGD